MKKRLCAAVLFLCLLFTFAAAEAANPGDLPRRGIVLPITQTDLDMGLNIELTLMPAIIDSPMPAIDFIYTDAQLLEAAMADHAPEALEDAALMAKLRSECSGPVGQMLLILKESYDLLTADLSIADALGIPTAFVVGENDGYVYVGLDYSTLISADDEALQRRVVAAGARAAELMAQATFQPLVFDEDEFYAPRSPFPAFATVDLNGNAVTSDIFAGKALTVVNVWGTYCGPCIDEMDELAAWSKAMPENVQLIGLVSDLYSADDTVTLETALAICEATGADAFPSLVANADFAPLLSTMVGVPTTFFVNAEGMIVGDPVVGANVNGCMVFVEDYLNAQ